MKEKSSLLVKFSIPFQRQREAAPLEIKTAFLEAYDLFMENPLIPHPSLRSHPLKERYSGYLSIDVTGDWRAIYKIQKKKTFMLIIFRTLGTHEQLYGKI